MECFICGNKELKPLGKNLSFPKYQQYNCELCRVSMTCPIPPTQEILEFYQAGYYVRDDNPTNLEIRLKFSEQRAASQFQLIEKYLPRLEGLRALDVGCSEGALLLLLHKHGFHVTGYELDKRMVEFANTRISQKEKAVKNMFFEEDLQIEEGVYDLICSSNVFEHVKDPINHLKKLKKVLKKNGVLFMEIPNEYAMVVKNWKINQTVYPTSATEQGHLFFYSTNSIAQLLKNNTFDVLITSTCGENMEKVFNFLYPNSEFKSSIYLSLTSKPHLFTNYWQNGKEGVWIRLIASPI